MDKEDFIKVAPQYYSLAIIAYLYKHGDGATSRADLSNFYHVFDEEVREDVYWLEKPKLFSLAIDWLNEDGLIDVISDPFGPPIISQSSEFPDLYERLSDDKNFPLFKYRMVKDGDDAWLHAALRELDLVHSRLRIMEDDFDGSRPGPSLPISWRL